MSHFSINWGVVFMALKSYAAYAVLVAFVNAFEPPVESSSSSYRWCYRFLHGLPINTFNHETIVKP